MKESFGRKVFLVFTYLFLILFSASIIYPFLNVLAVSLNEGLDAMNGSIYIIPRKFSLEAYKSILSNPVLFRGLTNSILRTVIGTAAALFFTAGLAFILAKKDLLFRRFFLFIFVVPMYLHGGMIPTYLLMQSLGLIDNFLVYILPIPLLLNIWNLMVMRSFFENLPESLIESAEVSGANGFQILVHIVVPISKPVIATVGMFYAVAQWNSWFDTYVYTNSNDFITLQGLLIKILMETQLDFFSNDFSVIDIEQRLAQATPETIKMATIIISTVPIVLIYPFLQKYFVKGTMIGAVKG